MKKLFIITLISMSYLLWSCNSDTSNNHDDHNHESEETSVDDHEGHDHAAVEDDHDHDAPDVQDTDSHEGHDHSSNSSEPIDTYGLTKLSERDFQEVIRTSGQILSAQGDEITITAIHEGMVFFNHQQLMTGKKINKGSLLLSISSKDLIHGNIEISYRDAKAAFEISKKDFDRAQALYKEKIIKEKDFLETKLAYEKANSNYDIIKKNYSKDGQKVLASDDGYIKEVLVTEGQYVTKGQPIIKITKNKRLVVKADVPQRYFGQLQNVVDANFITVYDKQLYRVNELNGKLISYGKTTATNSVFTPLYFEIDNVGSLMAGSFIEIYLKTAPIAQSIVIPKSAILEETGRHYVYIKHGEEFEKSYIEIDCHDGENYHITKGLKAGDILVTKNPYQIKLASMSNSLPAHGHQH